MSRLPPALARRVDRLARRAHAFHRWAHHPLCSWYAPEVLHLGRRTRVCLGCSLVGAGALAGLAAGLLAPALPGLAVAAASGILVALVPLVVRVGRRPSTPGPPAAGENCSGFALAPSAGGARLLHVRTSGNGGGSSPSRRARKLLTRFLPMATATFVVGQALLAPSPTRLVAALLSAAAVSWVTLRYRRRGPDRSRCTACPEGPAGARCPGLAPIAHRERALSRLAGRWIAAAMAPAAVATRPSPASCSSAPRPRPSGGT